MDILIKGLEIPNSCIDPKTSHGCFCLLHCKVGRQRVNDGKSLSGRPFECPLIPVPEHGRLGDLDAIRESLSSECPCHGCEKFFVEGACMNCQWDRFVKLIDDAPTVLEATND